MTASESTFAQLRRRERERRIAALRQRLRDTRRRETTTLG